MLFIVLLFSCKKEDKLMDQPDQGKIIPINDVDLDDSKTLDTTIEKSAEYPGGIQFLRSFLAENFDISRINEDGKVLKGVFIFVIERDGSVSNVEVKKSSGNSSFDIEVIKVLRKQKKWKPAKYKGESVRSYYSIPFVMDFR